MSSLVVDPQAKGRIQDLEAQIYAKEKQLDVMDGHVHRAKYNKGVWKGSEEHENLKSSAQTERSFEKEELLSLKDQLAKEMNKIDIDSVEQNLGPADKQVLALMLSFKMEMNF